MRRWGKSLDIFIVKGAYLCTIQDFPITIVKHDVDGVRFTPIWEFVPVKPYFIAGEGSLELFLGAVRCRIVEIS